ncbi:MULTISPECIES: DUF4397 domain-containing protein [Peribacillus]|uniref:DUF4397 domain-containing protein n=1 Tax=Peribacillus TaxID=2675229 RepID=UPI001F4E79C8|nr:MULTISPECIES: DUF4397 domain-containing protein [unclassified Peribacillus]MCK1982677.1 DUF4397 domain-containing protein [Peribacillus sp. Aquil_B1]MCK2008186.1 DUF4397 domain-containing protein [Peribacillus sp. Aquil_B8]
MSDKQSYPQKSVTYDLLSSYYKNSDPQLHDYYFHNHLKSLEKSTQQMRYEQMNGPLPAQVRFLHAAPTAPSFDVYLNEMHILKNFSFKENNGYLPLPPGKYPLEIYCSGQSALPLLSCKVALEGGTSYTIALASTLANESLSMLSFEDNPFVPPNEAKVRFIQLSHDLLSVDIAVKDGDVVFDQLHFRKASEYLNIHPMIVDFEVRISGTKEIALPLPNKAFQVNTPTTIYLIGSNRQSSSLETLTLSP